MPNIIFKNPDEFNYQPTDEIYNADAFVDWLTPQ